MKKIILFFLLSISLNLIAQSSQKISIKGTIVDNITNTPLEFATAILLKSNTIITGVSTNEKGEFNLKATEGSYTIRLEFIGYKSVEIPVKNYTENQQLGNIKLDEESAQLDEIQITAEKSTVEYKLDKKVFNVGKDLISKGGSVNDILNNVPSVTVDATGGVSLRGNGNVQILINGKPSVLTSNNGLAQIPAENIEKVEVSTNPSSKYGAEGTAGIINVILKRNKKGGFSSSVQVTTGSPVNNALNYNVNYKTEKFNIFSNLSYTNMRLPGTLDYFQTNTNSQNVISSTKQHVEIERNYKMTNVYVGGDYYINDKNTLTFSYYLRNNNSNHTTDYSYDFLDSNDQTERTLISTNNYKEPQKANQIEVNYVKTFEKPGKKFTANIQYEFWNDDENENITEKQTFPTITAENSIKSRDVESSKDLLFQADYVLPIFEKSRLEMGVKGEVRRINSDYKVWDNAVLVDSLDNLLHYDEKIYGAYLQYGNREKKFQYSLGLRMEHSDTKSTDRKNVFFNHKKYTDLFPTVHLTYNFSDSNSLQLSYSKRITRPRFWQLNPFGGIADKNNIRYGNPDLNPMYTNSFEIGTLKRWNGFTINPSIYFQRSTNIFEMITYKNSNNVIITIPVNLGSENRYGAELVSTYSPYKWWRLSADVNFYGFKQKGSYKNINYDSNNSTWTSRLNSTMKFTDFSLQSTVNYVGARTSGQTYTESIAWFNLGMSKDFLNDRMTLTLNANNLFNSRETKRFINGDNYNLQVNSDNSQRRISATFIYRFNRSKKDRDRLPD
ncbi:MAG: outer membrane receptor protein involved in Fe transport [Flavobacteriales bacterium]|jgi:outer membrane receptor protein involved in Fe transport